MGRPLSERFERSPRAQLLISSLIVLVLLAQVISHLPDSPIERLLDKEANRVIRVVASEQSWGVFAPNPRSTSLQLTANVHFADGRMTTWEVPEGPRIGGNLRYYRWRKWLERVRSDDFSSLWRPSAEWIASLYDDEASPVTRVELVRHYRDNVVEGEQPEYEQYTFYTLELEDEVGG